MSFDLGDPIPWLHADHSLSYLALATGVAAVYDHLTTLDVEINLVWRRPKWRTVQVLFFLSRYSGVALQIYTAWIYVRHITENTVEGCKTFHITSIYIAMISLCSMQGIMAYRVSSMYVHKRNIIMLLAAAVMLEITSIITILIMNEVVHTNTPTLEPEGVHLCKSGSFSRLSVMVCIPILLFESLILLLASRLGYKYYLMRKETELAPHYHSSPSTSLLNILLRDSILFPFIIVICAIINVIADMKYSYFTAQTVFVPSAFIPAILGPRLILNLREVYYAPFLEEVNPARPGRVSSHEWYPRYPILHLSDPGTSHLHSHLHGS